MPMSLPTWSTGITTFVICIACVTDLRSRRIPNELTFPAILIGLVTHIAAGGWGGTLFSISGGLLAPSLLSLLHAGKGPGAGDLKLAAVLGVNLGPPLGTLAILISAVAGGLLAALWLLAVLLKSGPLSSLLARIRRRSGVPERSKASRPIDATIIPYGLALSIGAVATLLLYWGNGGQEWLM